MNVLSLENTAVKFYLEENVFYGENVVYNKKVCRWFGMTIKKFGR